MAHMYFKGLETGTFKRTINRFNFRTNADLYKRILTIIQIFHTLPVILTFTALLQFTFYHVLTVSLIVD